MIFVQFSYINLQPVQFSLKNEHFKWLNTIGIHLIMICKHYHLLRNLIMTPKY